MLTLVAIVCFCAFSVGAGPSPGTPTSLCNQFRGKTMPGFKYPACVTAMTAFLAKVTDVEYQKLVGDCVQADMRYDLCAETISALFEQQYAPEHIRSLIASKNVKRKEEVADIAKLTADYWKGFDDDTTVWSFAKEIAQDKVYREAIETYKTLDKGLRDQLKMPYSEICVLGKAAKLREIAEEDLPKLYNNLVSKSWSIPVLGELLSSEAMKKVSMKQLEFMIKYGQPLADARKFYSRRQFPKNIFGAWPYEEIPFLRRIPSEDTPATVARFKTEMACFTSMLTNVFSLPFYRKMKTLATEKGLPEAFAEDFLCNSHAFHVAQAKQMPPYPYVIYKDMVIHLAHAYTKNKEALDAEELADFNKTLFYSKSPEGGSVFRAETSASAVLKTANDLGLDLRQTYDFIKQTHNYKMQRYLLSDAMTRLWKLGMPDVFELIRYRNINFLYDYIDLFEDEELKTATEMVVSFFKSNAKPGCNPSLIRYIVQFNDRQPEKLNEEQRTEALEAICQLSNEELKEAVIEDLVKRTGAAKTYGELMDALKSKLPPAEEGEIKDQQETNSKPADGRGNKHHD